MGSTSAMNNGKSDFGARARTLRAEVAGLKYGIPPLLVLLVALFMFEIVAFDLGQLSNYLHLNFGTGGAWSVEDVLGESHARYLWGATALIYLNISVFVIIVCGILIYQSLSRQGFWLFVGLGALLAIGGIANFVYSVNSENALSGIFTLTFDSLRSTNRFEPSQLRNFELVLTFINGLSVVVPAFAIMAGCAAMTRIPGISPSGDALTTQMRRMREAVNAGVALMVAGILHMNVWLSWPAALVANEAVSVELAEVAQAVSIYWGAAFTLLIMSFYITATVQLGREAMIVITRSPEIIGDKSPDQWLKEHRLSLSLAQQLPQLGLLFAPLLAGPIGTMLVNLSGLVGT